MENLQPKKMKERDVILLQKRFVSKTTMMRQEGLGLSTVVDSKGNKENSILLDTSYIIPRPGLGLQ
jgi:hypothetical protein